jgi:hypothetical protein
MVKGRWARDKRKSEKGMGERRKGIEERRKGIEERRKEKGQRVTVEEDREA